MTRASLLIVRLCAGSLSPFYPFCSYARACTAIELSPTTFSVSFSSVPLSIPYRVPLFQKQEALSFFTAFDKPPLPEAEVARKILAFDPYLNVHENDKDMARMAGLDNRSPVENKKLPTLGSTRCFLKDHHPEIDAEPVIAKNVLEHFKKSDCKLDFSGNFSPGRPGHLRGVGRGARSHQQLVRQTKKCGGPGKQGRPVARCSKLLPIYGSFNWQLSPTAQINRLTTSSISGGNNAWRLFCFNPPMTPHFYPPAWPWPAPHPSPYMDRCQRMSRTEGSDRGELYAADRPASIPAASSQASARPANPPSATAPPKVASSTVAPSTSGPEPAPSPPPPSRLPAQKKRKV